MEDPFDYRGPGFERALARMREVSRLAVTSTLPAESRQVRRARERAEAKQLASALKRDRRTRYRTALPMTGVW
jgi:hypothetical protein